MCVLQYQKVNKEAGNEWFTIESNKLGTRWTGKVRGCVGTGFLEAALRA